MEEGYMSSYNGPYTSLITVPTAEPLTLAEVKSFLSITGDEKDAMLNTLITLAREYAEQYIKGSLMPQSWQAVYTGSIKDIRYLPCGPLREVVSVKLEDKLGNSSLLPAADYEVNLPESYITFDRELREDFIKILYRAGYADAAQIPVSIKQGMLLHIKKVYSNLGKGKLSLDDIDTMYRAFRVADIKL